MVFWKLMMSATHGAKKFAEHNTSSYKLICIKTQASKNLFHLCLVVSALFAALLQVRKHSKRFFGRIFPISPPHTFGVQFLRTPPSSASFVRSNHELSKREQLKWKWHLSANRVVFCEGCVSFSSLDILDGFSPPRSLLKRQRKVEYEKCRCHLCCNSNSHYRSHPALILCFQPVVPLLSQSCMTNLTHHLYLGSNNVRTNIPDGRSHFSMKKLGVASVMVAFVAMFGVGLMPSAKLKSGVASREIAANGKMKLFDEFHRYVLEDYDAKPTFSSFLPGVAGLYGKPVWSFYVNRGQGVASFGSKTTSMMWSASFCQ